MRVEHLGVRHAADVARDPVRAEPLEEVGRAGSGDIELRERRLVEQRRALATCDMLGADRGRPQLPRPAARS